MHPYGWLSLTPPLTAIVLAIATRRVVMSLIAGVLAGCLVMSGGNPLVAVSSACQQHLWPALTNPDKLAVFAFTALMGALVGIVNHSGGMRGLVDAVARWASNRQRGQLSAWLLGLLVFFDDYANTLLLGGTLRPLFDRLKISREKLAYLVDSTAAPVSGLALVSTWVAVEIEYVAEGLRQLPAPAHQWSAFQVFVSSIPYRFYALLALLLIPIVILMRRDLGAMAHAERRTLQGDGAEPDRRSGGGDEPTAAHWLLGVAPIATAVGAIFWLLCRSGAARLAEKGAPLDERTWTAVLGNADTSMSLVWGSLMGVAVAAALSWLARRLTVDELQSAAGHGARQMLPALAILWVASSLSTMTGNTPPPESATKSDAAAADAASNSNSNNHETASNNNNSDPFPHRSQRLYTGDFLSELIGQQTPPAALPSLVFLLAAAVAFSTGSSWGTMGLLTPLVIGTAYQVVSADGQVVDPHHPILLGCVGSVLAGAIFGDHCSPISDTTILSSQACGCDHVAHVRTQLPYALLAGGVAIACGTIPVAMGVPAWWLLPLGGLAMAGILRVWGQRAE